MKAGKAGVNPVTLQALANVCSVKFSILTVDGSTLNISPYTASDNMVEVHLGHVVAERFVLLKTPSGKMHKLCNHKYYFTACHLQYIKLIQKVVIS